MTRSRYASRFLLLGLFVLLLAPGAAAESISLPRPVPSFNQNYTDGTNNWGICSLGMASCPDTVWESGCLVTAVASTLAYYGVTVDVSAAQSSTGHARSGMDPGILNDWLRAHNGFESCNLVWEAIPNSVTLTQYVNRSEVGLNPVASIVIDYALRQGNPVIAGVHWNTVCRSGSSQSENCHWIVITGKVGDTYAIMDPINWDTSSRTGVSTTLDRGTKGAYVIDRYYVVAPAPPADSDQGSADQIAENPLPATSRSPWASVLTLLLAVAGLTAVVVLISSSGAL